MGEFWCLYLLKPRCSPRIDFRYFTPKESSSFSHTRGQNPATYLSSVSYICVHSDCIIITLSLHLTSALTTAPVIEGWRIRSAHQKSLGSCMHVC